MEFKVGQITAQCAGCAGTIFEDERADGGRMHSKFRCVRCGMHASYSELIMQIGSSSRRTRHAPAAPTALPAPSEAFVATIPGFIALAPRTPKG